MGSCSPNTVTFEHNDANWRTEMVIPPAATLAGTTYRNVYRADGAIKGLEWKDGGTWRKLLDYKYRGSKRREVINYVADTGVELNRGETTYDDYGRPTRVEYSTKTLSTWANNYYQAYRYDALGRVNRKSHTTESSVTEANANWMVYNYKGPNWIQGYSWEDGDVASPSATAPQRNLIINSFGQSMQISESQINNQGTSGNLWDFDRDAAGMLTHNTVAPIVNSIGDQVLEWNTGGLYKEKLTDRFETIDDQGLTTTSEFTLEKSSGPTEYHTWNYQYDAWGRATQAEQSVITGVITNITTYDFLYDGYGRRVQRILSENSAEQNVEYSLYEKQREVATIERANSSCTASVTQLRTMGLPERPRNQKPSNPGGGGAGGNTDPVDDWPFVMVDPCGDVVGAGGYTDNGEEDLAPITVLPHGLAWSDPLVPSEAEHPAYLEMREGGYVGGNGFVLASTGVRKEPADEYVMPVCGNVMEVVVKRIGVCGTIIDDWMVKEINLQRKAAAEFHNRSTGVSTFNFITYGAGVTGYKDVAKFAFNKGSKCGNGGCKETVTLCGNCIRTSNLGNIMLMVLASFMLPNDTSEIINKVNKGKGWLSKSIDPYDSYAYKLGSEFGKQLKSERWDLKNTTKMCEIFNAALKKNPKGIAEGRREKDGYNDYTSCSPCKDKTKETRHGPDARLKK